jgi:hypothetical protein
VGIEEYLKHSTPAIKQFAAKVAKRSVTPGDLNAFVKYIEGPKLKPEDRPAAEALLALAKALGDDANGGALQAKQAHDRKAAAMASGVRGPAPVPADNANAAPASLLGLPFHNPYTFIPFGTKPTRRQPTPLTIDETDRSRFTGVLELEVRLLSPLLSCDPKPVDQNKDHKEYRALTIGDDVIVPATGVKGALRTLLTILTGGTLGYIDETLWLCQGRDLNLGPRGKNSPAGIPESVFLAKVIEPGTASRAGTVQVGETKLFKFDERQQREFKQMRPGASERQAPLSHDGYEMKLSGRPVQPKGKREGGFQADPETEPITLGPELWAAFLGRHRHANIATLKKGDLVWLEPASPDLKDIRSAADVKSIQWARWGRRGTQLLQLIRSKHAAVLPDALNNDGLVDEVTDLFGQVPLGAGLFGTGPGPASAFAARVRPENLVFLDGKESLDKTTLAVLAAPHPGCLAFYRDQSDADAVSASDPLRGYKVYRTTTERGASAPWLWDAQPVFDDKGAPQSKLSKQNKTVELLKEGVTGLLRIAVRSLSERELSLLLLACSVDWRLGGGKPLGLGHARVTRLRLLDEFGKDFLPWTNLDPGVGLDRPSPVPLPGNAGALVQDLAERARLYQSTQRPVTRLRYPRAVDENGNKKSRGGHVWFQRHAQPTKVVDKSGQPLGLQVIWTTGTLKETVKNSQIRAQVLPRHEIEDPTADVLYGYDGFVAEADKRKAGNKTEIAWLEEFNAARHARASDKSGGNTSQNRDSRREQREND